MGVVEIGQDFCVAAADRGGWWGVSCISLVVPASSPPL